MSDKIIVTTLGESVTEATVSKWLKNQGEKVTPTSAPVTGPPGEPVSERADLGKIDKMYGGDGPRSTTSKTKVSPKAYNMLSKDVKVLRQYCIALSILIKFFRRATSVYQVLYQNIQLTRHVL